jgi:hypothetical protein
MSNESDRDKPSGELVQTKAIPYPTSRLGARIELIDLAAEIERADHTLGLVVGGKLEVIRDQMRALQAQARKLLEDARESSLLQRASCNFKKIPGKIYHLYRRPDGELYFSMLSPDDWNGSPPHKFEASYKVEIDLSLVPLGDERNRPDGRAVIKHLLNNEPIAGELTGKTV